MVTRRLWLVALTLVALGLDAAADVVRVDAALDNTLYENPSGSISNGIGQHIFAGNTGDSAARRAVIEFDVASAIPAGATIGSVTLTLHLSRTRAPVTDVSMHRLLADWSEGTSDAPDEEGGGAPSTPGDATWIHTSFDTAFWSTPGGDFLSTASATTPVGDIAFYTWASTPGLVTDVQQWLDGLIPNEGWMLIGNEAASRMAKRFDSRSNPVTANRPVLTVEYTPVMVGACCDAAGGCSEVEVSACTGSYQGDGTVCGAGGTCGGCCDGPSCELRVASTCAAYAGDGVPCTPDPCLAPLSGACCDATAGCSEVAAADCTGSFQGEGTVCGAGDTCGACCDGPACELRVASTCTDYAGDGTGCSPDPCAVATGACCQDTICTDGTTAAECAAIGGVYQGDGQSCSTAPCDDKSRACCFPDETCIVMNRDACDAQGGDRGGGSSTCAGPFPCASTGACCFGSSCTPDMEEGTCETAGGDWQRGQTCEAGCEARACCLATGCEIMSEAECDALGGEHKEAGVTCTPDPCGGAQPCDVGRIDALVNLMAVKANGRADVQLTWPGDPDANGYNTWYVTLKSDLPVATSVGPATSVTGCFDSVDTSCLHVGAVAESMTGPRLFYNVLGVCDGIEAAE